MRFKIEFSFPARVAHVYHLYTCKKRVFDRISMVAAFGGPDLNRSCVVKARGGEGSGRSDARLFSVLTSLFLPRTHKCCETTLKVEVGLP